MYGEVGQVAPAVSNRGYARCLLAVAAWTPREAPAAARRRPGRLLDMVTLAGLSNSGTYLSTPFQYQHTTFFLPPVIRR